ncbi:MAG: uracil-DNA glycosylase [Candidatus Sumerlaeaceae bacterium]
MIDNLLTNIRRRLEFLQELGFMVWLAPDDVPRTDDVGNSDSVSLALTHIDERLERLRWLSHQVASCRKCSLASQRKNPVFGVGNPYADLVFIGEAPGAREDETGIPFVGSAGELLTHELKKHGISRDEVYICNILKCRPPNNRDPLPEEISACEPYLLEQLDLLRPKMLCGLGRFAVMTLLRRPIAIMKIRGTWRQYHGIPLFVSLHPAAVLHQPQHRSLFEADMAALAQAYHRRHEQLPQPNDD